MRFIGIDPGLGGAIACIDTAEGACIHKMPTRTRSRYKGKRVDWTALWHTIIGQGTVKYAVVEAQHSMPQQGVASTFTFGGAYEGCVAVMDVLAVPYEEVSPQDWQKVFGIQRRKGEPGNATKLQAKAIAQGLFPVTERVTLATADALLIAEFARRRWHGKGGDGA